jgi:hypothetical protein
MRVMHIVATDDESSWGDDVWMMMCGKLLFPDDEGAIEDGHDFVSASEAHLATCEKCKPVESADAARHEEVEA